MKNFKKLGYALALSLSLLVGGLLFSPGHKAFAEDINTAEICVPPIRSISGTKQHAIAGWLSLAFTDRAHITAKYTGDSLTCATPAGNNAAYFANNRSFDDIFNDISSTSGTLLLSDDHADSDVLYGEAVGGGGSDDTILNHFNPDGKNLANDMKDPLGGYEKIVSQSVLQSRITNSQLVLSIEESKAGFGCSGMPSGNFVLTDGNPPSWQCYDSKSTSDLTGLLVGAANYSNLDKFNITYTTVVNGSAIFLKSVYPNGRSFEWCGSKSAFINDSCNGNLRIKEQGSSTDATQDDIKNLNDNTGTFSISDGKQSFDVVIAGNSSAAAAANGSTVSTDGGDLCNQGTGGLEWALCPFINYTIGGITGLINKGVEDQLSFDSNRFLSPDVHKAWSVFKDLVSTIVVIIMLVMIISQAIDAGPFSAYTIKKLLPKLVVAIIAMQLSWDICIWLISMANDAGQGIGQIIAAPFGGIKNLQLAQLLIHLNPAWNGLVDVALITTAIFSTTLVVLFLPGVALMLFSAFLTVLIAVISLLFRNALIVVLVMLAPVGFLAWVLPNTQSYWKMWKDNFTRLLLLFPIMMALIYGGRAFAYVVGGLGHAGFMDFIMVLVGYFVPYAMLPKAFKWGGSFMKMAYANTVDSGAFKKIRDTGNRIIGKDFNEYWKGRMAREMYNPYDKTAKLGSFKGIPIMQGRLAGRLGSQHFMPTAHGRAQTLREGSKWAGERREDAKAFNRRRFELGLEHGYAVDKNGKSFLPTQGADTEERGNEVWGKWTDKNGVAQEKKLGTKGQHFALDQNGNWRELDEYVVYGEDGLPELDENGKMVKKATVWNPGTGAAKQALVDMVSITNSGDERISKDAVEQLIETSSNPEIEHAVVSYGKDKGKRVFETDSSNTKLGAWEKEVGGSQKLYPEEAKANYDLQVHLIRNAYGRRGDGPLIHGRDMRQRIDDLGNTPEAQAIKDSLTAGNRTIMAPHHKTLYNIAHDMGIDAFGSQSLGFWQRQYRNALSAQTMYGDSEGKAEIGTALSDRFADMAKLGEAGASIMRPLIGGEKGAVVNQILALDPNNVKDWKAVEVTDDTGAGTGEFTWEPVHKTVEDFAKEAHDPSHAIPVGVPEPSRPAGRDDVGRNYSQSTADGEPASGEPEAETGTPQRTASTGAEGTTRPEEGAGAAGRTQGDVELGSPSETTLRLHAQDISELANAVSRGVSQGLSSANINLSGVGSQPGGQILDEEMRNEFRRLHAAVVAGNATQEERVRHDQMVRDNPHIDPETGEDVPMGGA